MPDTKLSALTADTTPTSDDLVYTVNDPAGTPGSKKSTAANFITKAHGLSDGIIKVATGVMAAATAGTDYVAPGGALGTPSSGVATNLTGTASGLTAGTVTTNANLTGVVTSVGNATAIADAALSIAKTSGLQTALDAKQPLDADLTTLSTAFTSAAATTPASLDFHEGTNNGTNKITVVGVASVASDRTLTLPDATDTLVGKATTDTLTNKTIDANGTGNSITNIEVADLAASAVVTAAEGLASSDNDTSFPTTAAVIDGLDAKQPLDSDLTTIAGLTATTDNFIQAKSSAWASRTPAQVTADLSVMVGDSGAGGSKGLVPAPVTGDATKFLKGDGTWSAPSAGSVEGTAVLSTGEAGGSKFLREDGDGTCSWQAIPGGGDALTSSPLSQFAATTSAQLAGVMSDETGSGALVFGTSPTLTTPTLGVATATTINKVTLTAPATAATITATDGTTTTLSGGTHSGTNTGDQTITLTGDVAGSGTGSFSATIANSAVTYAKMQNVSGTDKVLGRTTAGAGIVEEIGTTGSGNVVRATSPTLTTPLLGTPTSGTLTNCTGLPVAGITSSTSTALGVGSLEVGHASDTTISRVSAGKIAVEGVSVVTTSSTDTLTNKRITKRVQSVSSSATVTPDFDSDDAVIITAQAANLTLANPTGTPTAVQPLIIRIKDNGSARTITFGSNYRGIGGTLPTTTVASKTLYLGCLWNATDTKVDVVSAVQEP